MRFQAETNDEMVDALVDRGEIVSSAVEQAFRGVDRADFVPADAGNPYVDRPLDIGEGQTISAPHMVAIIAERCEFAPGQRVLEVGTGRGYHAAVTAAVVGAANVWTVERHEALAAAARQNLAAAGLGDVTVVVGDGSTGLPEQAPFDRIYLTCAAPAVPDALLEQLAVGGRIVAPVGSARQTLVSVDKGEDGELLRQEHMGVRFVQLVGEEGF